MTTIAYDGKILAADTQATSSYIDQDHYQKFYEVNGEIVAGTGDIASIYAWLDWYTAGADPELFPKPLDDSLAILVIDRKTGKHRMHCHHLAYPGTPWRKKAIAVGTGQDFAMGALLAGATAPEAVKIAMKLDPCSGGQVRTIEVKT